MTGYDCTTCGACRAIDHAVPVRIDEPVPKYLTRSVRRTMGFASWEAEDTRQAAVAEPDVRHLHGDGHAVDQYDLVAPVELVGLAGRKAQRHISAST